MGKSFLHSQFKFLVIIFFFYLSSCESSETHAEQKNHNSMNMKTPASIETEHAELHEQLEKATRLPDQTGAYARQLAHLLHQHFVKEEKFALPPLALLPELSQGRVTEQMRGYIALCDTLQKDWPVMLKEHEQIKQKLEQLQKAAEAENQHEVVEFAKSLKLHAQTEEEILYPTAILIGEYLKIKLGNK